MRKWILFRIGESVTLWSGRVLYLDTWFLSGVLRLTRLKLKLLKKNSPHASVKEVKSFLGHAGFYRRFINDFSKITKPLKSLLHDDETFGFDDLCHETFCRLKETLITASIMQQSNLNLPFEIMCNASDFAVMAILCQKKDKRIHVIYYASRTLDEA